METPGERSDIDAEFGRAMREISRAHIAEIWRRGEAGEALHGEDLIYYSQMRLHPEYREIWERATEFDDIETDRGSVNPFLHISIHSVIEKQIADNEPPEAAQALFRLTRAGIDRHEAVHRIANECVGLMWSMFKEKRPFDQAKYRKRLRALKP